MNGRANVISDKEFRDKNKALATTNQQKHGEEKRGEMSACIKLVCSNSRDSRRKTASYRWRCSHEIKGALTFLGWFTSPQHLL